MGYRPLRGHLWEESAKEVRKGERASGGRENEIVPGFIVSEGESATNESMRGDDDDDPRKRRHRHSLISPSLAPVLSPDLSPTHSVLRFLLIEPQCEFGV